MLSNAKAWTARIFFVARLKALTFESLAERSFYSWTHVLPTYLWLSILQTWSVARVLGRFSNTTSIRAGI